MEIHSWDWNGINIFNSPREFIDDAYSLDDINIYKEIFDLYDQLINIQAALKIGILIIDKKKIQGDLDFRHKYPNSMTSPFPFYNLFVKKLPVLY